MADGIHFTMQRPGLEYQWTLFGEVFSWQYSLSGSFINFKSKLFQLLPSCILLLGMFSLLLLGAANHLWGFPRDVFSF